MAHGGNDRNRLLGPKFEQYIGPNYVVQVCGSARLIEIQIWRLVEVLDSQFDCSAVLALFHDAPRILLRDVHSQNLNTEHRECG